MDFFKKIWEWLSGNKTTLGLLILVILEGGYIAENTLLFDILQWLGGLLTATGVAHKFIKPSNANS